MPNNDDLCNIENEEEPEISQLQVMLGENIEETTYSPAFPDLNVSPGAFGTAQVQDPTLV